MRLGLGTVQFGMRYGIAHRGERPRGELVMEILRHAHGAGVRLLDTAPRYGNAEDVLGGLGPDLAAFDVVTKTVDYSGARNPRERARMAREGVSRSLARMGLTRLYGLLEHEPGRWLEPGGDELGEACLSERDAGRVAKVGVSALDLEQLEEIVERFPVDLVQLPVNAVDQRAVASGLLGRLQRRGVEVHVRSVFLQGALLAEPASLAAVEGLAPAVEAFHGTARARGLSLPEAALGFVRGLEGPSAFLVGVQSLAQLEHALSASHAEVDPGWFAGVASRNPGVVDPSRWQRCGVEA